jgi:aromatic-amino-acid transaminase
MDFLISSRRARPSDDPIFALNAEATRRARAGENVVNATIGALLDDDGKLALMPTVVETLAALPPAVVAAYAPIAGPEDFRAAVVRDLLGPYGLEGIACSAATPGATGALRMGIDNFLEPQQTVLTGSFYWGPYRTLSDESGRTLGVFNMFDARGRFDVADLDRKLGTILDAQGRALVILNTPCHNPSGYSIDADEWRELAQVLARHGSRSPLTLLLDVAYGHYHVPGLEAAIDAVRGLSDKLLVAFAWSASKSFAHYGLRVGALVALVPDAEERRRIANAFTYSCRGLWSNCNAGGMAAITRVLADPTLAARTLEDRARLVEMMTRRVRHWNGLATRASIRYPRYDGGFFTTVLTEGAERVAEGLRARGVFVVPQSGALRVALCSVSERQIDRIVEALVEELPRGAR